MIEVKQQHQSINVHRFEREPLEKKFVKEWRIFNQNGMGGIDYKHLSYLLDKSHGQVPSYLSDISDRDIQVAETVIQWLGSTVGQHFIENVMKR